MVKDEKFNFEKDERVLCFHGPFIYEAKVYTVSREIQQRTNETNKILKREKRDDNEQEEYFVHYKGWKQT